MNIACTWAVQTSQGRFYPFCRYSKPANFHSLAQDNSAPKSVLSRVGKWRSKKTDLNLSEPSSLLAYALSEESSQDFFIYIHSKSILREVKLEFSRATPTTLAWEQKLAKIRLCLQYEFRPVVHLTNGNYVTCSELPIKWFEMITNRSSSFFISTELYIVRWTKIQREMWSRRC